MIVFFDVDGTLTPSRGKIDPEFKHWLSNEFRHGYKFVTGSDPAKTQEQLGTDLWASTTCYNCSGNHVFVQGVEQYRSPWRLPADVEQYLQAYLKVSAWTEQTLPNFEHRVGLCNFSVLGRGAMPAQRHAYHAWDTKHEERNQLVEDLRQRFGDQIEVTAGGETGIDIYAPGASKAQVARQYLNSGIELVFIGDRQDPAGNDYELAQYILTNRLGKCYNVVDWQHTWTILKELNDAS
jgi:phosphomannomutase